MRLKFLSFSNLTLLVALCLSSVAAWYSIIGLTAIFAGAVIPVIIMGTILEVGKITTTVWLRKYWGRCGFLLKLYLVPAVIALALLTSMGIFGFLSKAHMEQGMISGDVQSKIAIYDEKIKTEKENIEANRKALKQMDEGVDQVLGRSTTETGAEKAVAMRKTQQKERARLQNEILQSQKSIAGLSDARAPIAAEVRKVEAEVGLIKYIAALIYGDNADQNMLEAAVRWVIILLVIVFDPLAIALVLAANASKEWDEEGDSPLGDKTPLTPAVTEPAYEPDDGPVNEEALEALRERAKEELPSGKIITKSELFPSDPTINCYKCGTELINAPGIGLFCPNKKCEVLDSVHNSNITWEYISPASVNVEPEKSILEQHPYLTKGFDHFENLKPMVYKPEAEAEPTADTETKIDNVTSMEVKQDLPFTELPGGYVSYEGKHIQRDALFSQHPEFLKLSADASQPVNSSFGTKFPDIANKGDVFTRVDVLPNKVFKYDSRNWIEISKETSNTYLYNTKYLDYLVEMIGKGEYDPELLSDNERAQIEDHIKLNKLNQSH